MPVFVFFLGLLQLAILFSSKLVVEHAATVGARAAAVVFGDEARPYGREAGAPNVLSAGRKQAVRDAVLLALAPLVLDDTLVSLTVAYPTQVDGPSAKEGAALAPALGSAMVRVRVEATAICKIAIGNLIACRSGAPLPIRVAKIRAESPFPYQGARYSYE